MTAGESQTVTYESKTRARAIDWPGLFFYNNPVSIETGRAQ